ncbi:hypothetical protein H2200_012377 [Cladophialophora chaetospira]|uniref:Amidohydrolase-related domain-containing protein n=1 Tax=Cladophialophora chaetospira TaxID=386627 RepID=A0AA39CCC3_9EURO|nr:hypothetical protein H2200_012377 [Cladophialophora chaetospira]
MSERKFKYPVVDVWANLPGLGKAVPEVERLFEYSHADPAVANQRRSPEDVITLMDEAGVSQICLSAWSRPGSMVFSNEEVAEFTRAYPTRIFGLAAVNLHDPVGAVKELEHYVKKEGFVGLRVVPWLWALPPTDPHYWPLYVKCIELDIPFLTQVGHTAPACPSEVGRPVPYIDTIALKFPELKIIMGHIGYPWAAETVGVAWKHKNVYIDSSAWSPKYYAAEFVHFANTTGRKKCMFATNFPQLGFKACVDNVDKHLVNGKGLHGSGGLRKQCVEDFMGGNAIRVLKLPPVDLKQLKARL